MKKVFLILFIGLFIFEDNVYSSDLILNSLKEGKKIIFIRHAIAPGNGDPDDFDINDCETQRNLSKKGIEQSKNIGIYFEKNKIKIDKILSSEWCRCKDTAKIAFKNFETFDALNSFFSEKLRKNKDRQIKDLKKYISRWNGEGNLVLVTHYVVILEIINKAVSSGEIVILDKNLSFIGSIINY